MIRKIIHHTVFKNFSYLTLGTIISQIFSLLTVIKITKILHPDDYGLYTFILAQGALILTIADLGIQAIIVRSIARDQSRTNDLLINGMLLRLFSLITISLIYLIYNKLLGNLSLEELGLVFLLALISFIGKLYEIIFFGNQQMLPPAIINLISAFLWFILIFILPTSLVEVNILIYTFLGLNLFKNAAFYLWLKKSNLLIGKVNGFWISSKKILKESWPYFALTLVMLPYRKFSNNFLDINSTIQEVAFYNLSEKFIGPISMILDIALISIFPNLSALWISNKEKFEKVVKEGFQYFMLLGIILCFLFTMFAPEVLLYLFPASYTTAIIVCQIQIWFLLLLSIDSFIGTILGATNNEKKIFQLGLVNSIVSTPIIYYGSKYGAIGISIAYLCTFSAFQFYLWYVFQKSVRIKVDGRIKIWVLAIVLFVFSFFLSSSLSLIFKVICTSFILLLLFYLFLRNKINLKNG